MRGGPLFDGRCGAGLVGERPGSISRRRKRPAAPFGADRERVESDVDRVEAVRRMLRVANGPANASPPAARLLPAADPEPLERSREKGDDAREPAERRLRPGLEHRERPGRITFGRRGARSFEFRDVLAPVMSDPHGAILASARRRGPPRTRASRKQRFLIHFFSSGSSARDGNGDSNVAPAHTTFSPVFVNDERTWNRTGPVDPHPFLSTPNRAVPPDDETQTQDLS